MKKAADPAKDQSYVLYSLTQEQLAHTMFPLGDMNKHQTRMIADQQNFYNADKPDSQDICFVPDGDMLDLSAGLQEKTIRQAILQIKTEMCLGIIKELLATR